MDGRGRSGDGPDVGKRDYLQVGGPEQKTMDRDGADLVDCGMTDGFLSQFAALNEVNNTRL